MSKQYPNLVFKELIEVKQMRDCLPIINQLYPKITIEKFEIATAEMIKRGGYKMLAAYQDNEMVAVCGYYISYMLYCGRYLQFCNLVVDKKFRNQGIGKEIISYLEKKARELDCDKIVLDSYVQNEKSHSLYYESDFYIRGFHFMRDLT